VAIALLITSQQNKNSFIWLLPFGINMCNSDKLMALMGYNIFCDEIDGAKKKMQVHCHSDWYYATCLG
jgi:hypothetical protein